MELLDEIILEIKDLITTVNNITTSNTHINNTTTTRASIISTRSSIKHTQISNIENSTYTLIIQTFHNVCVIYKYIYI